jgi:hypothetical protein
MLLLTSVNDLVRLVTDAVGDIECHASWADNNAGTISPDRTDTASITTAITTTVVAAAASGQQRNIKHLNIRNNHASQAVLVTVFHTDGTNQVDLFECTLLASEALVFNEHGFWTHYDASGHEYAKASLPFASQAELEAATEANRAISPLLLPKHPAIAKFWAFGSGSGATFDPFFGTHFNLTSVTDTAAGRITFTIATDFSSANWACVATVRRTSTSLTVTNLKFCAIRSASQAAGSVEIECWDGTAVTAVQEDPDRYFVAGYGDQ